MKRMEVRGDGAKWIEEDIITRGQILEKSDCDVSSRAA